MKKQTKPIGKFAKMAGGGYPDQQVPDPNAPNWLQRNQDGLATASSYGAATIDAFDQKDAYGVRSNAGALGSGALSGAATGMKVAGPWGAAAGAVIGGATGLLGNKSANRAKTNAINTKTTAQLNSMEANADARIAGDPSLKYGRMAASYYRFGGTMKGTLPAGPRVTKPIAAVQAKPRLMPNIAEVPGRQISRLANGGKIGAPEYNLQKFKKFKPIKMEDGGDVPPLNSRPTVKQDHTKVVNVLDKHLLNTETKKSLDRIGRNRTSEQMDALNSIRFENGNPSIQLDNKRPNYTPNNNTIHLDTTGNNGPLFDYQALDEIAHARQYKDNPIGSRLKGVKDEILYGDPKEYAVPGTLENQAHSVIAPQLYNLYNKRVNLNDANTNKLKIFPDMTADAFKPVKYESGGSIHINPANKGKFNATKAATGKSTEELTHSSNPITKKRAVFAQNAARWSQNADGGAIEPLSSEDVKVNGPSHDAGGVKFPSKGVELEGGETVNNGFVFSKKLGFAKPAEKIARALGKAEARPDSPLNAATVSALQRKTELLKGQQEATKASMGIPNEFEQSKMMALGGPIEGDDPKHPKKKPDPTKEPTYDTSLLTNGKFMVGKADGSTGQWGNPVGTSQAIPVFPGAPVIQTSDKATGLSNTYYPARNQQTSKSVPTQYPSSRYKFGGKMKQVKNTGGAFTDTTGQQIYADGGFFDDDPKAKKKTSSTDLSQGPPIATITASRLRPGFIDPGSTPTSGMNGSVFPTATVGAPNIDVPISTTPQLSSNSKGRLDFNSIADKASPFLSNFINATTKLPLPPTPILNTEITPALVDYSASRADAVRAARSADASAARNLNSGAAVSATKAANLVAQQRSIGQINEAENTTNAGIRNQVAAQNSQIKAGNTSLQNNYQNELVSRQLKGQQLKSQNFANIEEKIQGMSRDKKLFDLEDQKAMLGWLQNNDSGAGYDAVRGIFAKHLSPESLKQMDDQITKQKAERAQDRAETVKMGKLQLDYLKRKGIITDNPFDLIGNGVSVVNSAKDEQADSKTRIKKKE